MSMQKKLRAAAVVMSIALGVFVVYVSLGAQQGQSGPRYVFDPGWPQPLPNNWKMGGVTGLAVDPKDDTVWAYDRPNDLTNIELEKEIGIADCCTLPPAMIHFDKDGKVIGSFQAPQGHGMDVDSKGFAYLGQNTVRKYDVKTGKLVGAIEHTPETEGGGAFQAEVNLPPHTPGRGGQGPVVGFLPPPAAAEGRGGRGGRGNVDPAAQAAARAAFRAKYPPTTPMIVGGIEEIRVDEAANEIYVADNYLSGRVMVFDLTTLKFKRGWGAYGHKLTEISTKEEDHEYKPNGPMAKEFVGHLTFNFSNDGLVYAADRNGNRIHVTDKQGNFKKEFKLAEYTGVGGSTGGVAFSPDRAQRYLYISDLTNNHVWFLNREDGKVVGQLGSMGENGGQFFGLHMIATDSKGNIYTGEVFAGERVQRFVPADSARGKHLDQLSRIALN
jgi:DNA-binding beta-propeller fold protein YncE